MQNQSQQQRTIYFLLIKKHTMNVIGIFFVVMCLIALTFGIWGVADAKNFEVKNLSTIFLLVILPIFGGIFTFLQVYVQLHTSAGQSTASETVSQIASSDSRSNATFIGRNINRIPPYTPTRIILQLKKPIKGLYRNLRWFDITAIVLTGIAGVGKTTIAALIYQTYCASGFLRRVFCRSPLWLEIKPQHTFKDIIAEIFNYLNRPLPSNFNDLDIDGKVVAIASALAGEHRAGLVILDQFDHWLDCKTGYPLSQYSDVDALLYVLNNQVSKCQVLLTSRVRPRSRYREANSDPKACMTEYTLKDLRFRDGIQLLRKRGVHATRLELLRIVNYCHGHPGSLAWLATILQDEPSLHLSTDDFRFIQRWKAIIVDKILKNIYLQLEVSQRGIVTDLSIYRIPTSLEVVLGTPNTLILEKTWEDIDTLLRQHLLQKGDNNCYCLHPMVANCSREYLYRSNEMALQTAHYNAAMYYRNLGWPTGSKRKSMKEMQNAIEAIWHLCYAKCWSEAYKLMKQEGINAQLKKWRQHLVLLELLELLLPLSKWQATQEQAFDIYTDLSEVCNALRKKDEAKRWQREASFVS